MRRRRQVRLVAHAARGVEAHGARRQELLEVRSEVTRGPVVPGHDQRRALRVGVDQRREQVRAQARRHEGALRLRVCGLDQLGDRVVVLCVCEKAPEHALRPPGAPRGSLPPRLRGARVHRRRSRSAPAGPRRTVPAHSGTRSQGRCCPAARRRPGPCRNRHCRAPSSRTSARCGPPVRRRSAPRPCRTEDRSRRGPREHGRDPRQARRAPGPTEFPDSFMYVCGNRTATRLPSV